MDLAAAAGMVVVGGDDAVDVDVAAVDYVVVGEDRKHAADDAGDAVVVVPGGGLPVCYVGENAVGDAAVG